MTSNDSKCNFLKLLFFLILYYMIWKYHNKLFVNKRENFIRNWLSKRPATFFYNAIEIKKGCIEMTSRSWQGRIESDQAKRCLCTLVEELDGLKIVNIAKESDRGIHLFTNVENLPSPIWSRRNVESRRIACYAQSFIFFSIIYK